MFKRFYLIINLTLLSVGCFSQQPADMFLHQMILGDTVNSHFTRAMVANDKNIIVSDEIAGVQVLEEIDGYFQKVATLSPSIQQEGDWFGIIMAIYLNTVYISASNADNGKGCIYIYEKPATGWTDMTETYRLESPAGDNTKRFGLGLAVEENLLIVGYDSDNNVTGDIIVFEVENGIVQNPEGNYYINCPLSDSLLTIQHFGNLTTNTLSIDNNILLVACPTRNLCAPQCGHAIYGSVFCYELDIDTCTLIGELNRNDSILGENFGMCVKKHNDNIMVSSYHTHDFRPGRVFYYDINSSEWQSFLNVNYFSFDTTTYDYIASFGETFSINNNMICTNVNTDGLSECDNYFDYFLLLYDIDSLRNNVFNYTYTHECAPIMPNFYYGANSVITDNYLFVSACHFSLDINYTYIGALYIYKPCPKVEINLSENCIMQGEEVSVLLENAEEESLIEWNISEATSTSYSLYPDSTFTLKVRVTDSLGCYSVDTARIFVGIAPPNVSLENLTPTFNAEAVTGSISMQVDNGLPPYSIEWNNSDTTLTITNLGIGNYCITVTDSNTCFTDTCIEMTYINNANIIKEHESIYLYPNPAKDKIIVKSLLQGEIIIYNSLGKVVLKKMKSSFITELDMSNIDSGIYILEIAASRIRIVKE